MGITNFELLSLFLVPNIEQLPANTYLSLQILRRFYYLGPLIFSNQYEKQENTIFTVHNVYCKNVWNRKI